MTHPSDFSQLILDSTIEGIWVLNLKGVILSVNQTALHLFGCSSPEAMVGKPAHDLIHAQNAPGLRCSEGECPFEHAIRAESSWHARDQLFWRNAGSSFHADCRLKPLLQDGKCVGWVVTFLDTSEAWTTQRLLAVERENLSRLFETASAWVAVTKGPRHVYAYVNLRHQEVVAANFTGRALAEAVPEATALHALFDRVFATGKPEINHRLPVQINGETHYMDATYVAQKNEYGEIDGVMAWGMDVTESVVAQRDLEAAIQALRSEREARERFVETLSHDLRTPLTAVKMSAQLMQRKLSDPEMIKNATQRIIRNIDRSERMILDLLDANRLKAGQGIPVKLSLFRLDTLVESLLLEFENLHGPRFEFINEIGPVEGYWDSLGVQRILENLVGNAVKYGREQTPIRIKISTFSKRIEISVHNEGNPIKPEDLQSIFHAYQRTDSANQGNQLGWGIGLTLVKGITEALKGEAGVESSLEGGTKFYIRLPKDLPAHQNG